ncbi:MAG: Gfo/Idh/MocA family oxidoreductase, partial [Paracoccaceae bacterium]|nr:Gfo/Idh/MocA family oxidoreductase [Paracoccaceae bacterium]
KQAAWRVDPTRSGGGAIGDIGTHAFNLVRFVSGLEVGSISASLTAHATDRRVDDDARVSMKFRNGATGHIWASQVAIGNENNLTLEIYGTGASLRWAQENPNILWFTKLGEPQQIITRGSSAANPASAAVTRIPPGHPEGYLEAFATIYRDAAEVIQGKTVPDIIGIEHGLEGVRFVDACQRSSNGGVSWVAI